MNTFRGKILLIISCIWLQCPGFVTAQYAPPVGHPGTTALYKDSTAFVGWATQCSINRGWQDVSDTTIGLASGGDSSMAVGIAGSNGVICLGDGGSATLMFEWPLVNGPGWDFAVFENSFDDFFLELAFVEVSSDGENFYRFPAHSLTDTAQQTTSFDSTDATRINNLAGKYRGMYGTPFDLEELKENSELDLLRITHIRIVDVVGCLASPFASYDTAGNKVNDPWPTPFPTGGFDLDAVGVIWNQTNGLSENTPHEKLQLSPNPVSDHLSLIAPFALQEAEIIIRDLSGKIVWRESPCKSGNEHTINTVNLLNGFYIISIQNQEQQCHAKFIKA